MQVTSSFRCVLTINEVQQKLELGKRKKGRDRKRERERCKIKENEH